jgi:integrase
MQFDPCWS